MSNERPKTTQGADLPPELMGWAYSTWKKKDGSGEDSNRHTYLVDEEGKKKVISRAAFSERFDSVVPGGAPEPGQEGGVSGGELEGEHNHLDQDANPVWASTWPEARGAGEVGDSNVASVGLPRSGGAGGVYREAALMAISPGPAVNRAAPAGYVWYTRHDSEGDPIHRLVPSAMEESERKEKGRGLAGLGRLGRAAIKWSLGSALAIGVIIGTADSIEDGKYDDIFTDKAIELEATPAATPDSVDYEIAEPVAAPEAAEATEPSVDPGSTPAAESTQPVDSVELETTSSSDTEVTEPKPSTLAPETTEASGGADIEPVSDEAAPEGEAHPSDEETDVGASEALMVGVEVAPGDGVTQVLAKVLDKAGYPVASPDQLFESYEDLVTNPGIGPGAIFEGITLEYNPEVGEFWIQGEGCVEAHLTEEAAEWLQSVIP